MIERTCCPTPPNTAHTGTCVNSVMRCGEEKFFVNSIDGWQKPETFRDRNLLISVLYEGPWDHLAMFCLGIHRDNRDEVRWNIPMEPTGWRWVLGKLAEWAEKRDQIWRAKYAIKHRNPPERWKRRMP